eukprot:scaffold1459_cov260-Pinguiococcus_pyrenoidosus.AAC.9
MESRPAEAIASDVLSSFHEGWNLERAHTRAARVLASDGASCWTMLMGSCGAIVGEMTAQRGTEAVGRGVETLLAGTRVFLGSFAS